MKKRILTILLAVCMLIPLSACTTTSAPTAENTIAATATPVPNTATPATTTDATPPTSDGMFTPYAEPVTVTVGMAAVSNATYPDGDDITNNIWTRAYKDKFNIIMKTDWVSDEYDTKINLAIASQSLPDIFTVSNAQFAQLLNADMLADLTDSYNKYVSPSVKKYMDGYADVLATETKDGKIYGMPQLFYGYVTAPYYLNIRDDWFKEEGGTVPKTIQDVEDLMLAFMGKHGSYGLAIDKSLSELTPMTPAFGAYYDMWLTGSDGNIVYSSIQPEMKTALAKFADWYKKGILKPDFATVDWNAMAQDIINGKVGVQMLPNWWGYSFGADVIKKNGTDAYFMPYELPAVDGSKITYPVQFPNTTTSVVSKNCKNPEVLIKLMDFYDWVMNQAVVEGAMTIDQMTLYSKNNIAHVTGPFKVQSPLSELDQCHEVQSALKTGDTSKFSSGITFEKYNGCKTWVDNKDPGGIGYMLQLGFDHCAYYYGEQIDKDNRYLKSKLWGPSPDVLLKYGSTLNDLLVEGFTKIIMGSEPVDYFDMLVANWKAAGGDQVTEAVNQMYKK
jgi:putative aldouronate transport system substrate-binding protein